MIHHPLPDPRFPSEAGPCYLCAAPGALRRGAEGGSLWLCPPCYGVVSGDTRHLYSGRRTRRVA